MKQENVFFLGIGGIGMSNLARYFLSKGKRVGGYDRVETRLTEILINEGALIHFEDNPEIIPNEFLDNKNTLIVYTPAIPSMHKEFNYFLENGFKVIKRAQLLGEITKTSKAICVAGTHGKTTVSSMVAHLLKQSKVDCSAFLGGILNNYNSNLLLSKQSKYTVVEADEYDRSFHWLSPHIAIITSADPDHLDIYGTEKAYRESFEKFTSLIRTGGHLIVKKGAKLTPQIDDIDDIKIWEYSENEGDCYAENIEIGNGEAVFDYVSPKGKIKNISLGVPVKINIENSVAAIAAAEICGVTDDEIRNAMKSFSGIKRRFEFHIKTPQIVFIDDYAHHPNELTAAIESIKALYPDNKITAVFQPHLFTRTRDFAHEFGASLSLLDDIILLDVYPAREDPIEGVSSQLIFENIDASKKVLIKRDELIDLLVDKQLEVLVTFGAGDIDRLIPEIESLLRDKYLTNI